jgi:DNA-binding response OmpR family regulator
MSASILLVDDSQSIADLIIPVIKAAGYRILHVTSADAAMAAMRQDSFDAMLLDISLPGISGLKLLDIIKEDPKTAHLPVIMISVESKEATKLKALGSGADDYLVKPFSTKELLARLGALLRRVNNAGRLSNVLSGGNITIDVDKREVIADNQRVLLSSTEFDLLMMFLQRQGHVINYSTISEILSRGSKETTSANIYQHIKNLRSKLGESGQLIETVHGVGYRFYSSD